MDSNLNRHRHTDLHSIRSIFSKNLTQLDDSVTASAISDFDYLHRSFTNYVDKILSFLTTNLPLH